MNLREQILTVLSTVFASPFLLPFLLLLVPPRDTQGPGDLGAASSQSGGGAERDDTPPSPGASWAFVSDGKAILFNVLKELPATY